MLKKGDKIQLLKPMGMFDNVGEVCEVVKVLDDGTISFSFGNGLHMGVMSEDEFGKYFKYYDEPVKKSVKKPTKNRVTSDMVDELIDNSEVIVDTLFGNCTMVALRLPNSFVIVETSACVDPDNYSEEIGFDICMERIRDKVYELEGYKLCNELYPDYVDDDEDNYDECEDCPDWDCCQGSLKDYEDMPDYINDDEYFDYVASKYDKYWNDVQDAIDDVLGKYKNNY